MHTEGISTRDPVSLPLGTCPPSLPHSLTSIHAEHARFPARPDLLGSGVAVAWPSPLCVLAPRPRVTEGWQVSGTGSAPHLGASPHLLRDPLQEQLGPTEPDCRPQSEWATRARRCIEHFHPIIAETAFEGDEIHGPRALAPSSRSEGGDSGQSRGDRASLVAGGLPGDGMPTSA